MKNKKFAFRDEGEEYVFELRLPKVSPRYNPYMDEADQDKLGTHPTLAGVIDEKFCEYGFAFVIDMDYKGKGDQFSDIFLDVGSFMAQEEFEKLCDKHDIPMVVMPRESEHEISGNKKL